MSDAAITTQDIVSRLQADAEGHALRGNADAAYQAIVGLALAKQLLRLIGERDAEIAALKTAKTEGS